MKTERQIIDDLGNWLCTDMEKDLVKNNDMARLPPTADMEKRLLITEVAKRIQWYRDNMLD